MAISMKGKTLMLGVQAHTLLQGLVFDEITSVKQQPKLPQEPQWLTRRENNYRYLVGMHGANGWSIHPRQFGFYLHRSKPWPATNFGPFDSIEAAKAAFTVMKDIN